MHQLTCGIEIHQQLDTHKLFCSCRSRLVEEEGKCFHCRLRPTQSEMGEIDRAALAQKLADEHINISYAYSTGGAPGGKTTAVFKVGDIKKAMKIMPADKQAKSSANVKAPPTRK